MIELNKIYNQDCLEGMKLIEDNSIDMTLTDIPYGEVNRPSNGLRNLNKKDADIETFKIKNFIQEVSRITKGSVYIFCGIEQVSEVRKELNKNFPSTRHCIWEKNNPSPINGQYMWLSAIENCVYARKKGATFNEYCVSCVWKSPIEIKQKHPTQKPIKLFNRLILASTNEKDIVLDCCMGSGTTAHSCIKTNRNFIGFEISKEYCDIANQRIEDELSQTKLF